MTMANGFYSHSRGYSMGDWYGRFGKSKSIFVQFEGLTARTPYDQAVFYPAHLSLIEVEKFQKEHRDFISPWTTPAGQFLLQAWSGKNEFSIDFKTFCTLRRNLLERFARNVEGNLTIVKPRPETEPKNGILHDFMLSILLINPRLTTINGQDKEIFISDYRSRVNKCRNRERSYERSRSATVYRIK